MTLDMLADLKDVRNQGVELFITDSEGTSYNSLLTRSFDAELPSRAKWNLSQAVTTGS
jgi:hypothetical protein